MQSDIFGNGNRPILADYMERMSRKPSKEPIRNLDYGLLDTKPLEESQSERKVSGRKKKSGDANQRELGETSKELGETSGDYLYEQGEINEINSSDEMNESN